MKTRFDDSKMFFTFTDLRQIGPHWTMCIVWIFQIKLNLMLLHKPKTRCWTKKEIHSKVFEKMIGRCVTYKTLDVLHSIQFHFIHCVHINFLFTYLIYRIWESLSWENGRIAKPSIQSSFTLQFCATFAIISIKTHVSKCSCVRLRWTTKSHYSWFHSRPTG